MSTILPLHRRSIILGAFAIVMSLAMCGCQSPSERQPQLVILYATCTLNKDYLSPYNPQVVYTPNLEKFAEKSVVFSKHRTEAGLSGVAYASIFSGVQAINHGVFTHPTTLDDSIYLLSEAFADNGYELFFWNFHPMASDRLNYTQAVPPKNIITKRVLEESPELGRVFDFLSFNNSQATAIMEKVKTDSQYKALVIVNFTLTHGPYVNRLRTFCKAYPGECGILDRIDKAQLGRYIELHTKKARTWNYNYPEALKGLSSIHGDIAELAQVVELLYKSNVNHLDVVFGRLVSRLETAGLSDQALIVFTADHGESLFKETAPFKWCHGHSVQGEVLNVPFIVRSPTPGLQPKRADYVTRSIDVFPTIAGLAGLSLPADAFLSRESSISGRDLSGVLKAEEEPPSLLAYSHSAILPPPILRLDLRKIAHLKMFYPAADIALTWVAVRQEDTVWKYRNMDGQTWVFQAFDVENDPMEIADIYNPEDLSHIEMAERLKRYKNLLVRAYDYWATLRADTSEIPEAEKKKLLKSLGYI